ncbi:MAG: NAD(P)/FAD-dependent oxidoreductase [Amphiplicatus sp.]|nr:NAD(P)/FAD-dependent oxidoreductase [Amphiplicatus sp.]
MSRYDAIVVGGGHNGLTAAGYLAKAGMSVLVLERRNIVGGAAVTEEVAPGCRVSSCSYIASMLTPAVIRDLDLGRYGLKMVPCDPALNMPVADGSLVRLWANPERTASELRRYSTRDAESYVRVDAELKKLARYLQPFFLEPPPNLSAKGVDRIFEFVRLAKRFWNISGAEAAAMVRFLTGSLADFLNRHFEAPETKRLFLGNNVYGKHGGPYDAGSTLGLLFHLLSGGDHAVQGFTGHVIGGMGAITGALANSARDKGATILTDATVAEIRLKDGRAVGVSLDDGREFSALVILSNADPKRTFLSLVDARALNDEFRADVAAIRMAGPAAKVNLVLSERPDIQGLPDVSTPAERAVLSIMDDLEDVQKLYDKAKFGELSDDLWVDCVFPSEVDATLCPPDRFMATCFIQYVPWKIKDSDWNERREAFGDRVVELIGRHAPNVPKSVVARKVLTPLDLQEIYGLTEGNIFHGDLNLGQLFFMRPTPEWSQYRTPISGLYLCGAGAHPGGGVTGAPGRNAAMAALKDRR